MKKRIMLVLVTVLTIVNVKADSIEIIGTLNENIYTNNILGIKLTLPQDWNAIDDNARRLDLMRQAEKKIPPARLAEFKTVMKEKPGALDMLISMTVKQGSIYPILVRATKSKYDSSASFQAGLAKFPSVITAKKFIDETTKRVKSAAPRMFNVNEIKTEIIKGVKFNTCIINSTLSTLTQKYYTTIVNGYMLTFIINYTNNENKEILNNIINSIKFNNN